MWRCKRCSEDNEDSFDACWNCGAAEDGMVDPTFQGEPDDPSVPDPGFESPVNPFFPPATPTASTTAEVRAPDGSLSHDSRRLLGTTSAAVLFLAVVCALTAIVIVLQLMTSLRFWELVRRNPFAQVELAGRLIAFPVWIALSYFLWKYGCAMRRVIDGVRSSERAMLVFQKRFWVTAAVFTAFVVVYAILFTVIGSIWLMR